MKKVITLVLVTVLLLLLNASPVLAEKPDGAGGGNPLQALWDAIDQSVDSMNQTIEDAVLSLQGMIGNEETARMTADQNVTDAAQAANDSLQALLLAAIASGDTATADAAQAANNALQSTLQNAIDAEEAARIAGDQAVASAAQGANDALQTLLEAAMASGDAATAGAAQAANDALKALLETVIASGDTATANAAQAANDALQVVLEAAIASGDTTTANAAQDANDALQALLAATVEVEKAARIVADTNLQNQIDTIELKPGPQGPQGLLGADGQDGAQGPPGPPGTSGAFGDYVRLEANTEYVAATDGIVVAWAQSPGDYVGIQGIVWSQGYKTLAFEEAFGATTLSITIPVKKDASWKVTAAGVGGTPTSRVTWLPLGD